LKKIIEKRKRKKESIDAMNELESFIHDTQRIVDDLQDAHIKEKILKLIEETNEWLDVNEIYGATEYKNRLASLRMVLLHKLPDKDEL